MRFFFDMRDGEDFARDDIGVDLRSTHAARLQATIALTEMARDYLPTDGDHRNLGIEVRNAEGVLLEVSLEYALEYHDPKSETS